MTCLDPGTAVYNPNLPGNRTTQLAVGPFASCLFRPARPDRPTPPGLCLAATIFSSLYYPWGNEYTGGGNVNQAFRPNTGDTAQIRTFTMPSSGHCGHFSKRIQRNTPIGLLSLAQPSKMLAGLQCLSISNTCPNISLITRRNAGAATAAHPLPVQTKVQTNVNESTSL